jgi:hypothetical protein
LLTEFVCLCDHIDPDRANIVIRHRSKQFEHFASVYKIRFLASIMSYSTVSICEFVMVKGIIQILEFLLVRITYVHPNPSRPSAYGFFLNLPVQTDFVLTRGIFIHIILLIKKFIASPSPFCCSCVVLVYFLPQK